MRGRLCLLAVLFVILAAGMLPGQLEHAHRAPERVLAPSSPVQPPHPGRPWPRPPAPPSTFDLLQLSKSAGMIFSGTVRNITRDPGGSAAFGTIAITFHVENAIRGVVPGESRTITQWIGLWSSGQRYRIGDRALLFLYPSSKLGLTSCVGWPLGHFAMDRSGRVLLTAQQLSAFRQDPVLGGKSRVSFRDFALAVRQASRGDE